MVNTGIHARKWTRQQVINYHLENSPRSLGAIINEIERYIVLPGQATGYKIGMAKILEARTRARTLLGNKFDIRELHDVILTSGAVPMGIMSDNVNQWIANKKG